MKWICPYCEHTADHDAARVQHNCAARDGEMVVMHPLARTDAYWLHCANCRQACLVPSADLPDGEEWVCRSCLSGGQSTPATYYQSPRLTR